MRSKSARLLSICALIVAMISCGLPAASQPQAAATSASSGAASTEAGGGGFTPATPIADVCSLLSTSDIQAVMPGARPGVEQPTPDTSGLGFWSRDCKWDLSDTSAQSIELVVFGATTEQGLAGIQAAARSGKISSPVDGLGEEARYWVKDADNGLWAIEGPLSVDVTAYFLTPMPTQEQLQPLIAKALGEIK